MAEHQKSTQVGEMTQRFVEFVMMQAQNAALFLGQIPNPKTGEGEVNLDLAQMFIDQLAMIQEKTRGNLTTEESTVLRNTLSNLQLAFVEVSRAQKGGAAPPVTSAPEQPAEAQPSAAASAPEQSTPSGPSPAPSEEESKKKFTKSYGS